MKARFAQWWDSKDEQEQADWESCLVSITSIVTVVPALLIVML